MTRPLAQAMNQISANVLPDTSEFELAGLAPEASRLVAVPRVKESPASFECRRTQIIQLQTAAGEAVATWLVLWEVVAVQIDRRLLKERKQGRQSMFCAVVGRSINSALARCSCFGWSALGDVWLP